MKDKSLLLSVVALIVAIAAILGGSQVANLGGLNPGEAYGWATTTDSTDASATLSYTACSNASSRGCILGSVVISQPATGGYIRIWDATSTATSTYVTEPVPFSSSTYAVAVGRIITTFDSSNDVAGTYVFDVPVYYGVVVETASSYDGQAVISGTR